MEQREFDELVQRAAREVREHPQTDAERAADVAAARERQERVEAELQAIVEENREARERVRPPLELTIRGARVELTIRGARGDEWERAVGTRTFPVTSWDPVSADLSGHSLRQRVYLVDVRRLNVALLDRVCEHLARKFNTAADQVKATVLEDGLPIRYDDDCHVVLDDPGRWVG